MLKQGNRNNTEPPKFVKDKNFQLEIEEKPKNVNFKQPLSWPAHILVFGSTMSGKTTLISDILLPIISQILPPLISLILLPFISKTFY